MKTILGKLDGFVRWFKQASWGKKIGVIIACLIIIFLITAPLRKKSVHYQTAAVTRETIQETVSESGNIASTGQTGISPPSTGVLAEVDVSNGDIVTAGQALFKVNATATPEEQASAYATYASALSTLKSSQSTETSDQAALDKVLDDIHLYQYGNGGFANVGSANETQTQKTQREEAQAAVNSAKDAVISAQAAVNSAYLAYQATQNVVVTAPIGGTVENLAYGVGDKVTGGSGSAAASTAATDTTSSVAPVLYIVSNDALSSTLAVVQVNEVDFPKIKPGQTAEITLPAIPNKKFSGRIVRVDRLGTNTSNVISFNVYIALDNPDSDIAPNMTVDVDIATAKHVNALVVPNSAIKPYQGGKAVEVLDKSQAANKQLKFVPVTTGIKNIDKTEILSGLDEGAVVITGSTIPIADSTSGPQFRIGGGG